MGAEEIIVRPETFYEDLTSEGIRNLPPEKAEEVVMGLLAERARVKDGTILIWSEFNENPDPVVNELLARMLVGKVDKELLAGLDSSQLAIISVESSAAYLAGAVAYEVAGVLGFDRPPRIIRARKTPVGEVLSPAMGETVVQVEVTPITSGGVVRNLTASVSNPNEFESVKVLVVVDDFKATGSTRNGAVKLAQKLLPNVKIIIPMAALGKPEQELSGVTGNGGVEPTITAVDVRFWADEDRGFVLISNGAKVYRMYLARVEDFKKRPEVLAGNLQVVPDPDEYLRRER